MTKHERKMGIILILLSVGVIFYVFVNLDIGDLTKPGPGFFPLVCGTGIIILNSIWIITSHKYRTISEPFWEKGQLNVPLKALVVITVYTALMETLGYILSTLVFLVAWQFIVEREKWQKTVIIAVVGTAVMYMLFSYLLAVPLPQGDFGL